VSGCKDPHHRGRRDAQQRAAAQALAASRALRSLARELRGLGPPAEGPSGATLPRHSDDFRCVRWFGRLYGFTTPQAAAVAVLWRNWRRGTPDVADETLLHAAGVNAKRLVDLFKGSAAWGTMIVRGSTRGTARLQEPPA
jgi:hypothetical protein